MKSSPSYRKALLPTAILALLGSPAQASEPARCAVPACSEPGVPWSLCKPNALLRSYTPGLPVDGQRTASATDLDAERIDVSDQSRYVLEGDVRIQRADQLLRAQRIDYDTVAQNASASGGVVYQDRDLLLEAERAQAQLAQDDTVLEVVTFQLLGTRRNGKASRAELRGGEYSHLSDVSFTTCDPDAVDWEIRAREMDLDHANGSGTARGLTLRFKDVPLLYLPRASFPIDERRKSGWLYPSIGSANEAGLDLVVPYYLNLAPNYDATLYPRLLSERGAMLGGEFRYLTASQRGELRADFMPHDRDFDGSRHEYRFDHWGSLGEDWRVRANLHRVSDAAYFEDFGDSLAHVATSLLPSSAEISGRGEYWWANLGADAWQLTDPSLTEASEPYRRLPRLRAGTSRAWEFLELGASGELVQFQRDDALSVLRPEEGLRVDLYPYVALPIERAGWHLRPEIGYRYTTYELDREGPLDDSPDRGSPIYSLDAGLTFERSFQFGGEGFSQTLEPRLYWLRVPYENQDELPLFDTSEFTFGFGQLFRSNRFTGADRQMDANNLTLALTSRIYEDATGEERLSASIGQIRHFDDQRVQLPGRPVTDFSGSSYVGELNLKLDPDWSIGLGQQWNPETDQTELSSVRVQHRFGRRGVANLSYRYRKDFIEQVDASTLFELNERWNMVARWNYSLRDDDTLEAFAGFEYNSCCYALRLLGRHYLRNTEGESNNALFLEIEFRGLGSLGRRTEDFLERAILGYR